MSIPQTIRAVGANAHPSWLNAGLDAHFVSDVLTTSLTAAVCLLLVACAIWLRGQVLQINAERDRRDHRLGLALDSLTDYGLYMLDPEGRVMQWSDGAERLTLYRARDIVGRHIGLLYDDEDRRNRAPEEAIGVAATAGRFEADHEIVRKDQSRFWADGVLQRILDPDGQLLGFAGIERDLTRLGPGRQTLQRLQSESSGPPATTPCPGCAIQAAHDELKAANNKLTHFTSIVAHDLRAPLQRVEAFTRLLDEEYGAALNEDAQGIMARISKGAGRIRTMLDALLDYSKHSGANVLSKTTSLQRVTEAALDDLSIEPGAVQVSIQVDGIGDVLGDPLLLSHVLQNLVSNSIKFRHPDRKSTVLIEAIPVGAGDVQVSVTDNGIGVEPEYADRVFDMFYRLHDEDEYEGVGIGLSVCQKIISDHGGRIWFDKTHTGGARAIFTLRSADAARAPLRQAA